MRKYVDLEIFKQGSASAKVLAPLFTAIIDKLASTSVDDGQVSTVAITIGEPAKTGDNLPSNSYKVTNCEIIDLNAPNEEGELDVSNCTNMFSGCIYLQQVVGIISLPDTGYSVLNMFDSCVRLISFKIKNLAQDLDLHRCAQVSPESILYTIQNAKPDASFLITLETSVLEKYNSSADWAEVRSAVEANSKIVIA